MQRSGRSFKYSAGEELQANWVDQSEAQKLCDSAAKDNLQFQLSLKQLGKAKNRPGFKRVEPQLSVFFLPLSACNLCSVFTAKENSSTQSGGSSSALLPHRLTSRINLAATGTAQHPSHHLPNMTDSEQQQATSTSSQQQHVQAPPDPPAGTSSSAHVYLSNLPFEAYEGTIKHAFEQQGIQVVSSHAAYAVSSSA